MGSKKRQGPTLGARFTELVSVLYGCRSVKRESTVLVGQFEITHTTRGIFFQKEKRFLCCIYCFI